MLTRMQRRYSGSVEAGVSSTASIPMAAALRKMAPTFVGFCTFSSTVTRLAPRQTSLALLSGGRIESGGGRLNVCLAGCSGDIFAPDDGQAKPVEAAPAKAEKKPAKPVEAAPVKEKKKPAIKAEVSKAPIKAPADTASEKAPAEAKNAVRPEDAEIPDIPYDLMTVEQLQAVILKKMAKNGPVTERMRQDVIENIWHNSLVNWANSFR